MGRRVKTSEPPALVVAIVCSENTEGIMEE